MTTRLIHPLKGSDWQHQSDAFEESKDQEYWAYLFDPRCGKSRVTLKNAVYLYEQGHIDAVLVLAPNGVHLVWANEQIPEHWPVSLPCTPFTWRARKADQVGYKNDLDDLLKEKLPFLCVNVEAILSENCLKYLRRFFKARRCLLAIDESDVLKEPNGKRTKKVLAARQYAPYRRILTGTLATEGPFDVYAQFNFLDKSILGYDSIVAFRARYAKMGVGEDAGHRAARERYYQIALDAGRTVEEAIKESEFKARNVGRTWPVVESYCNLDELHRKISLYSTRVARSDISDAPPKIYSKRYFEMSPKQSAQYHELRERFILELEEGQITAVNVLARYTRLQQMSSNIAVLDQQAEMCSACLSNDAECTVCEGIGFVVPPRQIVRLDPKNNPRLEGWIDDIKRDGYDAAITWCRFDLDVDDCMQALRDVGRRPVQYDGRVPDAIRERNKAAYRAGDASDLVGKASAGGRGQDFSRTQGIYNYSHYFSLRIRLQGEDRGEAVMKTFSTQIRDILGEGTVDERIVAALRAKKSISDIIHGDEPRDWI